MSGNWLDLSNSSNRYIRMYVKGFVDVSGGNVRLRGKNDNLLVDQGDASLNGNVYVGNVLTCSGDVGFGGRLVLSRPTVVTPTVVTSTTTIMSPNSTAATSSTWSNNGVTWTSSASSENVTPLYASYKAFNSLTSDDWITATSSFSTSSPFACVSTARINLSTINASLQAESLKIQSSVPIVMANFNINGSTVNQGAAAPSIFYIGGSNDGSTWYPLGQYTLGASNPAMTTNSGSTGTIAISTSNQTGTASTYNSTGYSYATTAYSYFALIVTNIKATLSFVAISEWNINFTSTTTTTRTITTAITMAPSTTVSNQLDLSGGLSVTSDISFGGRLVLSRPDVVVFTTTTVSPNSTAATNGTTTYTSATNSSSSWLSNGVTWVASGSTGSYSNRVPQNAFDTVLNNDTNAWLTGSTNIFNSSGVYTGSISTTLQNSVGAVAGEWLQIQSSTPICAINSNLNNGDASLTSKIYYIAGSNDSYTWYPIIKVTMTSNVSGAYVSAGTITIPSGTTASGSGTTSASLAYTYTTYGNSTTAYSYFRLINTSIFSTAGNLWNNIQEWNINFTSTSTRTITTAITMAPSTTVSNQLDLSGGLSVTSGLNFPSSVNTTVSPNSTAATSGTTTYTLATNTSSSWINNGVTWVASGSTGSASVTSNPTNPAVWRVPQAAFDTVLNNDSNAWLTGNGSNAAVLFNASGVYTGSISTTLQNSVGAVAGEWLQIQSSTPLCAINSNLNNGNDLPSFSTKIYYIAGSTDNITWYPIIKVTMASAVTVAYTSAGTITIPSGTTAGGSGATSAGHAYTYNTYGNSTTAYSYFRLITTNIFGGNNLWNNIQEWNINFTRTTTGTITLAPSTTVSNQLDLSGDVGFGGRLVLSRPDVVTILSPNSTAATSSTWSNNGVTWTSSASRIFDNNISAYGPYNAFNNTSTGNRWTCEGYDGVGAASTSATTTVGNSVGAVAGEWLQIQSSVPVAMKDFKTSSMVEASRYPKSFYIVGSNTAGTWTPILYGSFSATPATNSVYSGTITIPSGTASSQTMTVNNGTTSVTLTYNTYGNSTSAFTYFRMVFTATFGSGILDVSEWNINFTSTFTTAITLSPSTTVSNQLDLSGGLSVTGRLNFPSFATVFTPTTTIVSPNSTAATSSTWSNAGVTWTSSASSAIGGWETYKLFDTYSGESNSWHSGTTGYTVPSGVANGTFSTLLYSNGSSGATFSANGEWIQIQSSGPVAMTDFKLTPRSGSYNSRMPKIFFVVGSNNGSNWTTIMYGSTTSTTGGTTSTVTLSSLLSYGSGTISNFYGTTSLSYTTYGNLSTHFTYFRIVTTALCGASDDTLNIGEWNINFTTTITSTTATAITLSPSTTVSNQLDLSGGLSVTSGLNFQSFTSPNSTAATTSTNNGVTWTSSWVANGVTWTSSGSYYGSAWPVHKAFDTVNTGGWVSSNGSFSTTSPFVCVSTGRVNLSTINASLQAESLIIQSSKPLQMTSFSFYNYNQQSCPSIFYIGGSNDGSTWYPLGYYTMGASNPAMLTANSYSGIITISTSAQTGTATTYNSTGYSYATTAYSYFALIVTNINYGAANYFGVAEWIPVFTANSAITLAPSTTASSQLALTGALSVSGSVSKASGTFDIKHPLDNTKRLVHSFIEGPRCDLIYRGDVALANGVATINLDKDCVASPECAMTEGTFVALNTNPVYYLQNHTSFDKLRGDISGNLLTITCENPSSVDTVYWQVISERQDPHIKEWDRTNPDGFLITEHQQ